MFIDESGFLLIPTRRRTWAPQGETPIILSSYRRERISALAALSVSAERKRMGLYVSFQQKNFKTVHVVKFLRKLLHHLRGEVIVLWDQATIHKGREMAELREAYPRLHIEWFPGYSPELNPVEFIWSDFKGHTANSIPVCKQDVRVSLHNNTRRARRSQDKLRSFVLASELPSPP